MFHEFVNCVCSADFLLIAFKCTKEAFARLTATAATKCVHRFGKIAGRNNTPVLKQLISGVSSSISSSM